MSHIDELTYRIRSAYLNYTGVKLSPVEITNLVLGNPAILNAVFPKGLPAEDLRPKPAVRRRRRRNY